MAYYKYKERDLDKTQIDWSSLTKDLSDNLIKEKNRRETAKFELNKKHEEQLQKINEFEQGMDPEANEFAMKQAQNSRDFLLQQHKFMTSGLQNVNTTKLINQKVSNTWSTLNDSLKTYNANYKRLSELDGKGNEAVLKAMSEQLKLKNKQIYHDPNTGAGYYAEVDANGDINMNTLLPVKALNTIQHQEFETIDVMGEAAKSASKVAQWKTFISSTQDLIDSRNNPAYQQWIQSQVDSTLSNQQKKASVLMDYLDIEYNLDGSPKTTSVTYQRIKEYGKDGLPVMEDVNVDIGDVEMVLNKQTGQLEPKLSDEQEKYAEEAYRNAIEIQIGREASKQYVAPIRPPAGESEDKNVASLIENFVKGGDFSSLKSALASKGFIGSKPPDKNGIFKIIDSKGKEYSINTKGKTAQQVGEEIAGPLNVAKFFKDRGVSGNLNLSVINPKKNNTYGVFVTAPTVRFDTQANRESVYKKLEDFAGPLTGEERSKEVAQRIQNVVGNKANITYKGDDVIINGTEVVPGGINNAAKVFSAIDNISTKSNTQAP